MAAEDGRCGRSSIQNGDYASPASSLAESIAIAGHFTQNNLTQVAFLA